MSLDTKGIYLAEVSNKYPKSFQTLGYDTPLAVDHMGKPKINSTFELCVNSIMTLLFMKPGQFPSIPELGIDIESYLHEYADDPNVPSEIKTKLANQCNIIQVVGVDVDCYIDKTEEGINVLIVNISGTDKLSYGTGSSNVIIGITYDKLKGLYGKKYYK